MTDSPETTPSNNPQPTAPPTRQNSGCLQTCLITTVALVVMLVLGVVVIMLVGQSALSNVLGSVTGAFQAQPSSAQILSGRSLVNSIQPLGQLVTISMELAQADITVEVEAGTLNVCGHRAHHVAEGAIEAGVDFTLITPDSISYTEATDTYIITVPYPQITSCRIEYIRQYDTSSNLGCSPNWDQVRALAQNVAMDGFVEDALGRGILERAERENTLLMQSFVNALTTSNVEIRYVQQEDTTSINLPSSCQPQLPFGWRFDAELNKWIRD